MFVGSAKDLRKGVVIKSTDRRSRNEDTKKQEKCQDLSILNAKKSVVLSSSITSIDGVIEKVKNDREIRLNDREINTKATKIQGWCRGILWRQKFRREKRRLFDNNISDISNLVGVCKSRNIEFVTPIDASLKLFTLFFQKYIVLDYNDVDEVNRLLRLCELVVFPSLIQSDLSKNIICNDQFLNKFGKIILDSIMNTLKSLNCRENVMPVNIDRVKKCVLYLSAFAGRYNENSSLDSRFNAFRQYMQNSRNIVTAIRSLLVSFSRPLIESNNMSATFPSAHEVIADELILFLIFFIEINGCQDENINQFYSEIFTVPILTSILSDAIIRKLVNWKYFINILKLCQRDDQLLPYTTSAIQSKHWLFGTFNILLHW